MMVAFLNAKYSYILNTDTDEYFWWKVNKKQN